MEKTNDVLKFAKQGNPKAIEAIFNKQLNAKNIVTKVVLNGGCLKIMFESKQLLPKKSMVSGVRKILTGIKPENIQTVAIYSKQLGDDFFSWHEEFELAENKKVDISSNSELVQSEALKTSERIIPTSDSNESLSQAKNSAIESSQLIDTNAKPHVNDLTNNISILPILLNTLNTTFNQLTKTPKVFFSGLLVVIVLVIWSGWILYQRITYENWISAAAELNAKSSSEDINSAIAYINKISPSSGEFYNKAQKQWGRLQEMKQLLEVDKSMNACNSNLTQMDGSVISIKEQFLMLLQYAGKSSFDEKKKQLDEELDKFSSTARQSIQICNEIKSHSLFSTKYREIKSLSNETINYLHQIPEVSEASSLRYIERR